MRKLDLIVVKFFEYLSYCLEIALLPSAIEKQSGASKILNYQLCNMYLHQPPQPYFKHLAIKVRKGNLVILQLWRLVTLFRNTLY